MTTTPDKAARGLKKLFAPRDMSVGTPWRVILAFAVPMLLGNIAQQLYNTVDTAVVGSYVGDHALAAVGSTFPIINVLLSLFVGIATGASILVSQYFGAKDREKLSLVIGNCMSLSLAASLITMALGVTLTKPLLTVLGSPPELLSMSVEYLTIIFLGVSGMMFYNILAGILRGLGDSLSALGFLLLTTVLNIALDLWFVISFKMGVAGVAWATVISQWISGFLCYFKVRSMKDILSMDGQYLKFDSVMVKRILSLGLPTGVTQAIFSMAMLLIQKLQYSFGAEYMAAAVILMRVDGFAMLPNFSFGQALTTFVGQNVGARKYERIKTGARQGTLLSLLFAGSLTTLILLFGRHLMQLFTSTGHVIDLAYRLMTVLAPAYLSMAVLQALSGVMRGAGDTVTPMWISMFTSVLLRLPLSYLFAHLSRSPEWPNGAPESIYIAIIITWTTGAIINYLAFRFGRWRRKLPQPEGEAMPAEPGDGLSAP